MPNPPNYITVPPQPFNPASYGGNIYATLQSIIIGTGPSVNGGVIGALNSQVSSYYNLSIFYQNNITELSSILSDISGGDQVANNNLTFKFSEMNGTVYLPGSYPSWANSTSPQTLPLFSTGKNVTGTYSTVISNPQQYLSSLVGDRPWAFGPPPGLVASGSGLASISTISAAFAIPGVAYYAAFYDQILMGTDVSGASVAQNFNAQQVNQQISVQQNYLQNEQTFLNSTVNLIETNISLAGQIVQAISSVMQAILNNTR